MACSAVLSRRAGLSRRARWRCGLTLAALLAGFSAQVAVASIEVVGQDASVMSGLPTANFNSDILFVGNNFAGTGLARTYLKFDLPAYLPGTQIASATLSGTYRGDFNAQDGFFDWHVAVSDAWTEGSINWNNQPGFTGSPIASWDASLAIVNQIYSWDITSAVNDAYLGDGTLSLVFKGVNEGPSQDREFWWAKENTAGQAPFQIEFEIESIDAIPEPVQLVVWSVLTSLCGAMGGCWRRRGV